MNINEITPLILTYNEAPNLARTLAGLNWAERIVVIDSGSTDRTRTIVEQHAGAVFIERTFDCHANQWNFGLDQVSTPWVLALDADYCCPPEFADELRALPPTYDAYSAAFRYCTHGKSLRGTLYPRRVVLFRSAKFRYAQDGHTQMLQTSGPVGHLRTRVLHDDRKSLDRWLSSQNKYADLEVARLLAGGKLNFDDRLRSYVVLAPFLVFVYCLLWKRLIFNGWPGVLYSLQRTYAELLLSLKLLDARITRRPRQPAAPPSES